MPAVRGGVVDCEGRVNFSSTPIAVIACGKEKGAEPAPAADLYTGPVFRARLALARRHAEVIFVASAMHGLIPSTRVIAPYDMPLDARPKSSREAWAVDVAQNLRLVLHASPGPLLALVSGPYAAWIPMLRSEGVEIVTVGDGLPVGKLRRAIGLELAT